MDDVSFQDIRVLPGQLELKGNNAKTLADLVHQLQSGSTLKGLVVGTTAKSEVIFHTAIGRFISPNPMGLVRGDTITIRLAGKGEEILGSIVKVNHSDPNIKEAINLAFIRESKESSRQTQGQLAGASSAKFSSASLENLPQTIRGNITYFNLSKVDTGSLLYRTLLNNFDPNSNRNTIEFRVLQKAETLGAQLQISGNVASESSKGSQMIRTPFGIVTTEGTNLKAGQTLSLEIARINNHEINNNAKSQLTEFIIKLNSSMPLLKKLSLSEAFSPKDQIAQARGGNMPVQTSQQAGQTNASALNIKPSIALSTDRAVGQTTTQVQTQGQTTSQTSGQVTGSSLTTQGSLATNQPPEGSLVRNPAAQIVANSSTLQDKPYQLRSLEISTPNATGSDAKQAGQSITDEILATAKGTEGSNKLAQELAKSGFLVSSLRMGIRKLRQNLEVEYNKREGIDLNQSGEDGTKVTKTDKLQPRGLNSILKNFSDMEAVKKLSTELAAMKEVFTANPPQQKDPNQWVSVFVPFHNAQQVYEQEVAINYPKNNIMRFLINAKFEMLGEIQLDGIIKFEKHISNPKSFDLTVRSNGRLDPKIQRAVNQIYSANQDITGVRGLLFFDDNHEFM